VCEPAALGAGDNSALDPANRNTTVGRERLNCRVNRNPLPRFALPVRKMPPNTGKGTVPKKPAPLRPEEPPEPQPPGPDLPPVEEPPAEEADLDPIKPIQEPMRGPIPPPHRLSVECYREPG
jgi:hypothetical protein